MSTFFECTNTKPSTLADILSWRAQHSPHREAYTFLLDTTNGYLGKAKQVQMTYADLDLQARHRGYLATPLYRSSNDFDGTSRFFTTPSETV